MPLPLTVSCFSKIQIGSGTGSPGQSPEGCKTDACIHHSKYSQHIYTQKQMLRCESCWFSAGHNQQCQSTESMFNEWFWCAI